MQIFPTAVSEIDAFFPGRHCALIGYWPYRWEGVGAEGSRSVYSAILYSPGIAGAPISLLSMGGICGRSLKGRENSLHWKANMLPLFSIMTLCPKVTYHD